MPEVEIGDLCMMQAEDGDVWHIALYESTGTQVGFPGRVHLGETWCHLGMLVFCSAEPERMVPKGGVVCPECLSVLRGLLGSESVVVRPAQLRLDIS